MPSQAWVAGACQAPPAAHPRPNARGPASMRARRRAVARDAGQPGGLPAVDHGAGQREGHHQHHGAADAHDAHPAGGWMWCADAICNCSVAPCYCCFPGLRLPGAFMLRPAPDAGRAGSRAPDCSAWVRPTPLSHRRTAPAPAAAPSRTRPLPHPSCAGPGQGRRVGPAVHLPDHRRMRRERAGDLQVRSGGDLGAPPLHGGQGVRPGRCRLQAAGPGLMLEPQGRRCASAAGGCRRGCTVRPQARPQSALLSHLLPLLTAHPTPLPTPARPAATSRRSPPAAAPTPARRS